MTRPPLQIHELELPRIYNTAASIPIYWQQSVHKDLLSDEALGVIERVCYMGSRLFGVIAWWSHENTTEHQGARLTLNKFCRRESPFDVTRCIPKQTWNAATDTWNECLTQTIRPAPYHFYKPFWKMAVCQGPTRFPLFWGLLQPSL